MAHASYLREKAVELRRDRGLTIDELAERLALSRSTIYYRVRDHPIDRQSNNGWPESARSKGNREVPTFSDFLTLFLAEGFKRTRHRVSISNSRFWAGHLGIDRRAIALQRKSNSNRLNGRQWRSPHGVLTVEANDTYLRARLQAWVDCIRDEWEDADTLDRAGA